MKTFTVVLLVVALCVERASSLHCYKCENAKSHNECNSVRCSDLEKHCVMLTTQKPGEPHLISKWCAASCPTTKGDNMNLKCCQEDNCNSSGPVSVKTSYAVVVMATLASFFCVLRPGL